MNALKAHADANKNRMNNTQRRVMMEEIKRQCADYYRKHEREIMALLLWELHVHEKTKWGYKRLKEFYDSFTPTLEAMLDRYEMSEDDRFWMCTYMLKTELGIDLEEWEKGETDESSTEKQKT